tara:strand:- start:1084 stop:1377 length:294 start_codon:yes stop_codon:yes gene_type:complete
MFIVSNLELNHNQPTKPLRGLKGQEMKTIQYKNHAKQKESFFENKSFKFSRFQDPRDKKWYAFVESKDDEFYMFNGPFKKKMTATAQIIQWRGIEYK